MSITTPSMTSNSKGRGGIMSAIAERLQPAMRKKTINGLHAVTHAPLYGASPSNAELDDDHIHYAELGTGPPAPSGHHHSQQPQTRQRRLLLGTPSLTRYLRNLGSLKNRDTADPQLSKRTKGAQDLGPQAAQTSRTFHVDLNVENCSYSRDTVGLDVKNSTSSHLSRPRTCSPDDYRRSASSSARQWLNRVPEEMETPLDAAAEVDQPHRSTPAVGHQYYGSVGYGTTPPTRNGVDPGTGRRYVEGVLIDEDDDSELSEEEEEWLLDEELAREGLYRGNYKNLVILYSLVPLSTLFAFLLLALLPILAFPGSSPLFPYPPYLPFPIPEVVTAMALWSLSYLLRDFLYATSLFGTNLVPFPSHRFPTFIPVLTSTVSAFLQSASSLFFRQLAIPLLLIPYYSTERLGLFQPYGLQKTHDLHKHHFPTWQDDAFRRVWWVALGWAAAEAVVGIKQGYESIALYKDALVDVKTHPIGKAESTRLTGQIGTGEDRMGRTFNPNLGPSSRAATPAPSPLVEDHTNSTPTQRTVDSNNLRPTSTSIPVRREHSDSLSSSSSHKDPRCDAFRDSLTGGVGEIQPLLKVDTDPLALTPRQIDESQRLLVENEVERDLEELMALKSREELEEVYGIPVIRIPVFISCLHRINSILSSLGICLLLTAAYLRSTFAYHPTSIDPSFMPSTLAAPFQPSNRSLAITLPPLLVLQTLLAMMHTPWILPRIGIHTFVYIGLLTSLGVFFGGLGIWEALT